MKFKEVVVYVLIIGGIIAGLGGFAAVSRGEPYGWLGVLLAVPMLFLAQRRMRPSPAS